MQLVYIGGDHLQLYLTPLLFAEYLKMTRNSFRSTTVQNVAQIGLAIRQVSWYNDTTKVFSSSTGILPSMPSIDISLELLLTTRGLHRW